MAKDSRRRRRIASRRFRQTPYLLSSNNQNPFEQLCPKKCSQMLDEKDCEGIICSVCMEYPHNAVLLLCSSHDKGCRPYMCGTSLRHSNCLDQYRKAYTKVAPAYLGLSLQASVDMVSLAPFSSWLTGNGGVAELGCPLCRGQVKGWTVVDAARQFLNTKRRCCMHDNCSFVGNYKELKKHVRAVHPAAKSREVDPAMEEKWRRLESEWERGDAISTVRSSMPGATFIGDYVIEGNNYGSESDEEDSISDADAYVHSSLVNVFLLLHAFGSAGSVASNEN